MTAIALFSAITCVLSQISVPLPFAAVPFTLSVLAVFLSGCFLSPSGAFLSQTVYLLIGAVGLPVFAGFRGGLSVFFGPTGGFLISYPVMALITALFIKLFREKSAFFLPFSGMLLSLVFCYAIGTAVFCVSTKTTVFAALPTVALPFIPFDIVKALIAAALRVAVNSRLKPKEHKKDE